MVTWSIASGWWTNYNAMHAATGVERFVAAIKWLVPGDGHGLKSAASGC